MEGILLPEGRPDEDEQNDEKYYGFSSHKCPPQIDELRTFEEDMVRLIESVTFRRTHDRFQKGLSKDIAYIKRSQALFVPADKTRNLYELERGQYDKLLWEDITKHYRTTDREAYRDINVEAQAIASRLGLASRMDTMAKREAFITLKDHKENFRSSLPCRLINPAKSEMGLVGKHILDSIIDRLKEKLNVVLWKNSVAVIKWFQSIEAKDTVHSQTSISLRSIHPSQKAYLEECYLLPGSTLTSPTKK